jgi:hypothetical protein
MVVAGGASTVHTLPGVLPMVLGEVGVPRYDDLSLGVVGYVMDVDVGGGLLEGGLRPIVLYHCPSAP